MTNSNRVHSVCGWSSWWPPVWSVQHGQRRSGSLLRIERDLRPVGRLNGNDRRYQNGTYVGGHHVRRGRLGRPGVRYCGYFRAENLRHGGVRGPRDRARPPRHNFTIAAWIDPSAVGYAAIYRTSDQGQASADRPFTSAKTAPPQPLDLNRTGGRRQPLQQRKLHRRGYMDACCFHTTIPPPISTEFYRNGVQFGMLYIA